MDRERERAKRKYAWNKEQAGIEIVRNNKPWLVSPCLTANGAIKIPCTEVWSDRNKLIK